MSFIIKPLVTEKMTNITEKQPNQTVMVSLFALRLINSKD